MDASVARMPTTEHVVLESDFREVPALRDARSVHARFEFRSRLRRRVVQLEIFDFYFLSVRSHSRSILLEYVLDLRFVDAPRRFRHVAWRWIGFSVLLITLSSGIAARIDSSGAPWWQHDRLLEICVAVIVVWPLATLVSVYRTTETVILPVRTGRRDCWNAPRHWNFPGPSVFHGKAHGAHSARVGGAPTQQGRAPARRNARASAAHGNRRAACRGVRDSEGAHPRPPRSRSATCSRSRVDGVISRPPHARNRWHSLAQPGESGRNIAAKRQPTSPFLTGELPGHNAGRLPAQTAVPILRASAVTAGPTHIFRTHFDKL